MTRPSPRLAVLVLLVVAVSAQPLAADPGRVDFWSGLWSRVTRQIQAIGCALQPGGRCGPPPEIGCEMDPNGLCHQVSAVLAHPANASPAPCG